MTPERERIDPIPGYRLGVNGRTEIRDSRGRLVELRDADGRLIYCDRPNHRRREAVAEIRRQQAAERGAA